MCVGRLPRARRRVRLADGYLYEHQGQKREYRRLYQCHKGLEEQKRHGKHQREKGNHHGNKHLAGKYIAKETEGERDKAREVAYKFNNADKKTDDAFLEVNKF